MEVGGGRGSLRKGGNEPNFDSRFVGIEATGISCGVWMQHHIVVITYNLAAALVAVYRVIRSKKFTEAVITVIFTVCCDSW